MIPLTLHIQNFLSYGSPIQKIDFSHYKLICLSGKNGHGKSALLDAITWALWGQARKSGNNTKADLGILKLGQTDVMVIFDFTFNKETYRVKRVFSTKYGRPKAHLDFGTYNTKTDYFTPLTDKTIRKTQDCIHRTIGLTYESFVNSSFLRQGQSNEFSKKSPKDRKEVLATILGLHRYEKAKKLALEKVRSTTQEKNYLEKLAAHIEQECEQIHTIKNNLIDINKALASIEKETSKTLQQQKQSIELHEALSQKQHKQKIIEFDYEQKNKTISRYKKQFLDLSKKWKKIHKEIISLPQSEDLEQKEKNITQKIAQYEKKNQKYLSLRENYLQHKTEEQKVLESLRKKQSLIANELSESVHKLKIAYETEKEKGSLYSQEVETINKQLLSCSNEIENLKKTVSITDIVVDTQDLQKQFERYKMYYQKWIEQGNIYSQKLQGLRGKQALSEDTNNPSCPLCEQNLSQSRKRFLHNKFIKQYNFLSNRVKRLTRVVASTKQTLHTMHAKLEVGNKIDALLKEQHKQSILLQKAQAKEKAFKKNIIEKEKAYRVQKELLKKRIDKTEEEIISDKKYKSLQDACKKIEEDIKLSKPHKESKDNLSKELKIIHEKRAQLKAVDTEKSLQKNRLQQISVLNKQIKSVKKELTTCTNNLKLYSTLSDEIKAFKEDRIIIDHTIKKHNQEKEKLLQQKGGLESTRKKIVEQQKEQKKYTQDAKNKQSELEEFQAVANALGKDGIQALLIEDALPEIEQEANKLLSKLTDNRTYITMESLRDLKKGGTKETLDINISDSSGTRPYEMFSGGEAFRLDFALRIAISKLLARRAGTSLQTLIIDEGFGSQDEDGLNAIMDVLYKIQDDFEKIIIVSHLSSMKDQFPVHFVIHKEPQGSKVFIKEQG